MSDAHTQRGLFITLEGGEGSGKSTLLTGLVQELSSRGHSVTRTREPGGTALAEAVRKLVLTPPDGEAWPALSAALLMNAARKDHIDKRIAPALARGETVICDRFADSTRVYQGFCGGVDLGVLFDIETAVLGDTRPDLTLILDIDPVIAAARRSARGVRDAFEDQPQAFHVAVREAFLSIAREEPQRCVVIDASRTPEAVLDDAMRMIASQLETTS